MSSLNTCVDPMLEFNYYITKCYCTCSFILGREMFWKRRCILQRKAFNIQGLIGDSQKQQRIRQNWYIHRDVPSEIRGGFLWFLEERLNTACKGLHFPLCPPSLLCWNMWLKITHILLHKQNIFIFTSASSNQSSFCSLVPVASLQSRIPTHSTSWHTNISPIIKDQECSICCTVCATA